MAGEDKSDGGVRERILDAAIEILGESGLKRLKQVAVAERAGVRQSHLTYYFPTRSDLLDAVTAHGVARLSDGIRQVVEETGGASRRALLERLTASVGALGHMRMFLGLIVEADLDLDVRRTMAAATERMERAVAEAMGGPDAESRARVLLATAWGLGLYRFLILPPPEQDPTSDYVSWALETLGAPGEPDTD